MIGSVTAFFDFDRAELSPQGSDAVDRVVAYDQSCGPHEYDITGHADAPGTDDYNRILAMRRATAVRAALIERGMPASRLTVLTVGSSQPLVERPGKNPEPQNRRVVIRPR